MLSLSQAFVKLWVRSQDHSRLDAVDPLLYALVGVAHKLMEAPRNATAKGALLSERRHGLLVQLATERESVPARRLKQGLHAAVLASGDQLNREDDTLLAEDHHAVLLPAGQSASAELVHTTLREVVLHGRGWYGESVLHLLMLMCDGTAPSVYRSTIVWLLQLPPQEQQSDKVQHQLEVQGEWSREVKAPHAHHQFRVEVRLDEDTSQLLTPRGAPHSKVHSLEQPPPPPRALLEQQVQTRLTREDLHTLVNTRHDGSLFLGQSPLHIAAARGDLAMADLLLSCGAVVDATCASGSLIRKRGIGSSPISFAVSTGRLDLVSRLHEHGAPLDSPIDATHRHQPALLPARIQMLMGAREQVSAVASVHAIHRAWCAWGELPAPRIRNLPMSRPVAGLNVQRALVRGSGLLHCAVLHNRVDIYRELIGMGVSPYVRDAAGKTPLLLAAAVGTVEMLTAAIESVSSRDWASGILECVRFPLNEIDPLVTLRSSNPLQPPAASDPAGSNCF